MWGFSAVEFRTVSGLFSLPVLVCRFMKVTLGPLNIYSIYCFLKAVVSDMAVLLHLGKLPLGGRALPLWGHRCCAIGVECR